MILNLIFRRKSFTCEKICNEIGNFCSPGSFVLTKDLKKTPDYSTSSSQPTNHPFVSPSEQFPEKKIVTVAAIIRNILVGRFDVNLDRRNPCEIRAISVTG